MGWPSIDHSILSPSGRASKRARAAAQKREAEKLFPCGLQEPKIGRAMTPEILRQQAADLRRLADSGVRPRVHRKRAAELEAQAAILKGSEKHADQQV